MKKLIYIVLLSFFSSTNIVAQNNELDADILKTIEKNNLFAFELYLNIPKNQENFIVAPYSVSSSLAMLFIGASGTAKKELFNTIHYLPQDSSINKSFSVLNKEIQKRNLTDIDIFIDNNMWVYDKCKIYPVFENKIKKNYQTVIRQMDMTKKEEVVKTINQATKKSSKMQIMEMLDEKDLPDTSKILITSSVYFNGKWRIPFDIENTTKDDFYLSADKIIKLYYMNAVGYYEYAENDFLQALDIPYGNNELAMTILLPKEIEDFQKLEQDLSDINFNFWTANMHTQQVNVMLPKFNFSSGYSMRKILEQMGLKCIFTPEANFVKMNGKKGLFLNDVFQKIKLVAQENSDQFEGVAFVDLNNYDKEIADVVEMKINKPYIFVIRDVKNHSVLFVGRVMDPSKTN